MRLNKKTLIILFTLSFPCFSMAVDSPESQIFRLLASINSFSSDFTQTLIDEKGVAFQTLSGNLHAKKPDKVYWTVLNPAMQKIISNGNRLWIYDADIEQVIVEPYRNNPQTNPISLLLGNPEQLNKKFELIAQSNAASPKQWFSLNPRESNAFYSSLKIEFENQQLSAISFKDNLGQTTQLELLNFKLNPKLTDQFFNFDIPDGVDVTNHVR